MASLATEEWISPTEKRSEIWKHVLVSSRDQKLGEMQVLPGNISAQSLDLPLDISLGKG